MDVGEVESVDDLLLASASFLGEGREKKRGLTL